MPVAPANEAQRLGELLCEGGQLGGAPGEVLNRAQLLGCRGSDRFGFLTRSLSCGARLVQ